MRQKTLIIFLSFFYFPLISQNIQRDDCQLYFSEIGIKDFNLGSKYNVFFNESKKNKREFIKESVYGIDIITFTENIVLLKQKKIVEYNLKFHQDTLVAYSFKINIGNFKNAALYYNNVLKLIDRNKNTFIKGNSYYYMKTTKECQKNFQFDNDNTKDRYIYGEISYESPIWEQQFKDYMKATGQEK
ncbi:hypothetical protein [Flavobacterium ginsengiterrae]|uniref:DKNYY family protein n=1 Tax=Flavobacterium ginsengiterrae TaxID=871695 RepID=A0ABP7H850_9FLAO